MQDATINALNQLSAARAKLEAYPARTILSRLVEQIENIREHENDDLGANQISLFGFIDADLLEAAKIEIGAL